MGESFGNTGAGRQADLPIDPVATLHRVAAAERDAQRRERKHDDTSDPSFRDRGSGEKQQADPPDRETDRIVFSEAARQAIRRRAGEGDPLGPPPVDASPTIPDADVQGFSEIV